MRVSYFHNLFRKLNFGAKDSMTLLSADGNLLMRAPFDIDMRLQRAVVAAAHDGAPAVARLAVFSHEVI
jgi:hypothetical protein